ncbi:hypothetical protein ACIQC5_14100 [Paenarthrobacter sp. NPDC092416]|uniref:hypothetical protein n=1 Tax=Paenarthrobacter sp. NPDC092416 TaxID=3364386 RepID=UPI003821D304
MVAVVAATAGSTSDGAVAVVVLVVVPGAGVAAGFAAGSLQAVKAKAATITAIPETPAFNRKALCGLLCPGVVPLLIT